MNDCESDSRLADLAGLVSVPVELWVAVLFHAILVIVTEFGGIQTFPTSFLVKQAGTTTSVASVICRNPQREDGEAVCIHMTCGDITVSLSDIVIVDRESVAVINPEQARRIHGDTTAKLNGEAESNSRADDGEYLYDIPELDERFDRHDVHKVPANGNEPDDANE